MRALSISICLSICLLFCSVLSLFCCCRVEAEDRRAFPMVWRGADEASAIRDPYEAIVTDRPDFTEASSTVGLGVSQFEMGYTFYYSDTSRGVSSQHVYPEVLLRQGVLTDWVELRVGQSWSSFRESHESGTDRQDMYLGTKIGLVPQSGLLPEMAIILQANIPSGSGDLEGDQILPGTNLLYSWDLSKRTYLGGGTQVNVVESPDGGDQGVELAQAVTMGTQLSQRIGMYGEWFAFIPYDVRAGEISHWFNTGVTFGYSSDVQFDVRIGSELSRVGKDIFTGAGVSFRFM